MSTNIANVDRPRLNPLPFPSDTTLRFTLLVTFVLCVSSQFHAQFWGSFHLADLQAAKVCTGTVAAAMLRVNSGNDVDAIAKMMREVLGPQVLHCASMLRPQAWWALRGILLTLAVTALIYVAYPAAKLRANRFVPLDPLYPPGLGAALADLCRTADLSAMPRFVWNPLARGHPVTFGRHGAYYVALSGGFISNYFYADPVSFRGIMLHELAHIRNGDVEKTYVTLSGCAAVFVTSLLPALAIVLSSRLSLHDAVALAFKTILWGGLVALSGLSVLRVREFYADVRASLWDGTVRSIDRALGRMGETVDGRLRAWVRFHPGNDERRSMLTDTSRLFSIDNATAFGIGFVGGLVVDLANNLIAGFIPSALPAQSLYLIGKVLTPALVMILALGAIGICTWRGAYAALLKGRSPSRGLALVGVFFALGYYGTDVLNLVDYSWGLFWEPGFPNPLAAFQSRSDAMSAIVIMLVCWLMMGWVVRCAAAWLEVVIKSESPRMVLYVTIAVLIGTFVILLAWASYSSAFMVFESAEKIAQSVYPFLLYLQLAAPPLLLMSSVAWMFPCVARWFAKARTNRSLSAWVYIGGRCEETMRVEPFHVGRAVWFGLFAGLAYCLLLELVYFNRIFPAAVAAAISSTFNSLTALSTQSGNSGYLFLAACALVSSFAAAYCAWRSSLFNVLYGLCAGSIAGAVTASGTIALLVPFDTQTNWDMALMVYTFISVSTLCAFVVSMSCAGIGSLRFAGFSHRVTKYAPVARAAHGPHRGALAKRCAFAAMLAIVVAGSLARSGSFHRANDLKVEAIAVHGPETNVEDRLGQMYLEGKSVRQDVAQALFWFRQSAEHGHTDAQNELGLMYFKGLGTPQDDALAAQWFERAAVQGHAVAQGNLGFMYASGRGVNRDLATAVVWFKRAAEKGNGFALQQLGALCSQGDASACPAH
ncbi:sel1 repeat family protein [Paraburkholderia youngii]|uniref:sel1 repeat family protein n=1 Tax=Paraburkholderia youngii TaxID=2782701 RepID=UPI003D1F8C03